MLKQVHRSQIINELMGSDLPNNQFLIYNFFLANAYFNIFFNWQTEEKTLVWTNYLKTKFSILAYTVRTMDDFIHRIVTEERLAFLGINSNVHKIIVLENAFKIFQKLHLTKLSPSDWNCRNQLNHVIQRLFLDRRTIKIFELWDMK